MAEDQPREPKGRPGGGRFAKKNGGGGGDDADEGAFPPGIASNQSDGAESRESRTKRALPEEYRDAFNRTEAVQIEEGDWSGIAGRDLRKCARELLRAQFQGDVMTVGSPLGPLVVTGATAKHMTSGGYFDARTADVLLHLDDVASAAVHAATEPSKNEQFVGSHRLVARVRIGTKELAALLTVHEVKVKHPAWPSPFRFCALEDVEVRE